MKVPILKRLQFACKAFMLKPGTIAITSYHRNGELHTGFGCDVPKCKNEAHQCLTYSEITINPEADHYHVCPEHANEVEGKENRL